MRASHSIRLDFYYPELGINGENSLFCWSEVGAEAVATLQSLIVACCLHDIDPYDYLLDVLQRTDRHPASRLHLLTPRL